MVFAASAMSFGFTFQEIIQGILSAILAILLAEQEAPEFRDLIGEAGGAVVSAGTAVELAAVASRDDDLYAAALTFLNEPFTHIEPVDTTQVAIATEAWLTVLS